MKDRRDEGHEGCRTEGIQERRKQYSRDSGLGETRKEGFMTGGMKERRIQDRRIA